MIARKGRFSLEALAALLLAGGTIIVAGYSEDPVKQKELIRGAKKLRSMRIVLPTSLAAYEAWADPQIPMARVVNGLTKTPSLEKGGSFGKSPSPYHIHSPIGTQVWVWAVRALYEIDRNIAERNLNGDALTVLICGEPLLMGVLAEWLCLCLDGETKVKNIAKADLTQQLIVVQGFEDEGEICLRAGRARPLSKQQPGSSNPTNVQA